MINNYKLVKCNGCGEKSFKLSGWIRTDKDIEWVEYDSIVLLEHNMKRIDAIKELTKYLDWVLHAKEHNTEEAMDLPSDGVLNTALGLLVIADED